MAVELIMADLDRPHWSGHRDEELQMVAAAAAGYNLNLNLKLTQLIVDMKDMKKRHRRR